MDDFPISSDAILIEVICVVNEDEKKKMNL